ncbi:M56 family metallopeptidase [Pelomonas cellulosilytica]|uniref:Peptidase M56 domain-containing protein n=1 Tax=Pelomonas cellulosilytica TaxID=2906762 RepID=A0ABS8XJZ0_9BURK|nr:M56 family metallopeptidase [Pelomonas sp. P8]MCE4553166.1 hypothetical protein [Pelomonas sp. P8]
MPERLLGLLLTQAVLLSMAVALLALLRLPLGRLGAGARYASWLLVPALLLTAALPRPAHEPLTLAWHAAGASVMPAAPAPPTPYGRPSVAWLVLWLGGGLIVALQHARRQWRLARLGDRLPAGCSPALIGLFRPSVALPADFEMRFTPAQRVLILAHEEVHSQRLDNLWNLLACGLGALHWWNPLAWWAARRMRADQELACDAAVLAAQPDARADYTQALLAAHDLRHLGAPLASRWGTTHPLLERIAMLNRPRRLTRVSAAALATILLAAAGAVYAVQGDAPPLDGRLVSLRLELSYRTGNGDDSRTRSTKATLRVHPGERALLMLDGRPDAPAPDQVAVAIVANDVGDDKIELRAELSKGAPLNIVSRPRLVTRNGVQALIELGREDPVASEHLSLSITPTLLADAKP